MKISEAKKKICHFIEKGEFYNHDKYDSNQTTHISCATTGCMAWLPTKKLIGFSCPCGNTSVKYGENGKKCDNCGTFTLIKVHEEIKDDGYCSRVEDIR